MVHPIPGRCPICQGALEVTRLHCPHCDITIEGRFNLGRLSQLSAEQLAFVETFIRCEGKLNRVEEELGISYPTVRNRLNEVIRALGYEVEEEPIPSGEERRAILKRLAAGEITTDEAIRMLKGRG